MSRKKDPKPIIQECGSCKFIKESVTTDSKGTFMGLCLNEESTFKMMYRYNDNYCSKFESKFNIIKSKINR